MTNRDPVRGYVSWFLRQQDAFRFEPALPIRWGAIIPFLCRG